MRRRSFFAVAAAAVVGLLATPVAADEPARGLRPVYRKTLTGWNRCRMFELKPGDVIRIERHPTLDGNGLETVEGTVEGEPYRTGNEWGVMIRDGWTAAPVA